MNSMIRVVTIIIAVIIIIVLLVIQLITIHFGINPINGGSPPRDKKFNINENLIILFLFIMLLI